LIEVPWAFVRRSLASTGQKPKNCASYLRTRSVFQRYLAGFVQKEQSNGDKDAQPLASA
jgi:hypothetical protein